MHFRMQYKRMLCKHWRAPQYTLYSTCHNFHYNRASSSCNTSSYSITTCIQSKGVWNSVSCRGEGRELPSLTATQITNTPIRVCYNSPSILMQSRVSEQYSAQTADKELIKSWSRSWLHWRWYNGVSGSRTRHDLAWLSSHWGCGAGGMVKILTVLRLIYRDYGVSGSRATVPCWLKTDGNQGNIERRKT